MFHYLVHSVTTVIITIIICGTSFAATARFTAAKVGN